MPTPPSAADSRWIAQSTQNVFTGWFLVGEGCFVSCVIQQRPDPLLPQTLVAPPERHDNQKCLCTLTNIFLGDRTGLFRVTGLSCKAQCFQGGGPRSIVCVQYIAWHRLMLGFRHSELSSCRKHRHLRKQVTSLCTSGIPLMPT